MSLGHMDEAKYRELLALLRQRCPPLLPVRVYRRPIKSVCGHTTARYDDDGVPLRFTIVLDSSMSWQETVDVLLHEWAHALAWREGHETVCDHDPEWGLAMSRVYQEAVEP